MKNKPGAPVVFFDKDGTLIHNVPYNIDPSRICFRDGAFEALRRLHDHGFRTAIVTNQAGVALGHFTELALGRVESYIRRSLHREGIPLAGFYYCPHHPRGIVSRYAISCTCRKPAPGLILRATQELGTDPHRCWMVGDILDDIEAGRRAGCRTILLPESPDLDFDTEEARTPEYIASAFDVVADVIIEQGERLANEPSRDPSALLSAML